MMAGVTGVFGAACFGLIAFWQKSIWLGVIAFFLFSQAVGAIQHANAMRLASDVVARPPPIPSDQAQTRF